MWTFLFSFCVSHPCFWGYLCWVVYYNAELASYLTNTLLARYQKLLNTYLLYNFGRKSYTWLNLRNGLQMQCIKPQESLLLIWGSRRLNASTNLSYYHASEKTSGRISGCILPCINLWKRLCTNRLPSIRGSYFLYVRYKTLWWKYLVYVW